MKNNKEIFIELNKLSEDQIKLFGLICLKRIFPLYQLFDALIDSEDIESTSENYLFIKDAISKIENENSGIEVIMNIKEHMDEIPFDDIYGSSDEFMLGANVLACLENTINYILNKETKFIEKCSDLMINSINIIVSKNTPQDTEYNDKETILKDHYEEELAVQLEAIFLLKNNSISITDFSIKNAIPEFLGKT